MKQLLLICAVVALMGCGLRLDGSMGFSPIVEQEVRWNIDKLRGELTKADLEKVTSLNLFNKQLTDVPKELEKLTQLKELHLGDNKLTSVKGLEKLTKLERLGLENNPDLTQAQIDELKKALPKCKIFSNPKN